MQLVYVLLFSLTRADTFPGMSLVSLMRCSRGASSQEYLHRTALMAHHSPGNSQAIDQLPPQHTTGTP